MDLKHLIVLCCLAAAVFADGDHEVVDDAAADNSTEMEGRMFPGMPMMNGGGMPMMNGGGMPMMNGGGMPMMNGGGMPMMPGNNFGGMMGPVTRAPRVHMPLVDECPANLKAHCFMNCLPVMQNATESGNFLPAFACMGVCCHLGPTYVYMFEEFRPRNDNNMGMGMGNGFGMPGMVMPGMDMNSMMMMNQMMNAQGGEGANPMMQMMMMQQMMNQQQCAEGEECQQGAMPNMMQMMMWQQMMNQQQGQGGEEGQGNDMMQNLQNMYMMQNMQNMFQG